MLSFTINGTVHHSILSVHSTLAVSFLTFWNLKEDRLCMHWYQMLDMCILIGDGEDDKTMKWLLINVTVLPLSNLKKISLFVAGRRCSFLRRWKWNQSGAVQTCQRLRQSCQGRVTALEVKLIAMTPSCIVALERCHLGRGRHRDCYTLESEEAECQRLLRVK